MMKDRKILELREKWNNEAGDAFIASETENDDLKCGKLKGKAEALARCAMELGKAASSED